jgi:hypothetical protein
VTGGLCEIVKMWEFCCRKFMAMKCESLKCFNNEEVEVGLEKGKKAMRVTRLVTVSSEKYVQFLHSGENFFESIEY